ncbi:EAL domain-containing protein [Vibrio sp.]|uniref:EAL domain-containing protein n=1 Tax=Vibrio sp. TaxID=678 RepID=UPI003AA8B2CF
MNKLNDFIGNRTVTNTYVSLFLIIIGLVLFLYQSVSGLRDMTERRLNIAVSLIDNVLDGSYLALEKADPFINKSCSESIPIMLNIVNTVSGLQSFNIGNDKDIIVCSTSDLLIGLKFDLNYLSDSDLFIKKSELLTPGHSLVILKRHVNNRTIFVTIAGSNLYTILDVVKNVDDFIIETPGYYLDNKGSLLSNNGGYSMTQASTKNSFKVNARITLDEYIKYGLQENLFLIIIFILLSMVYSIFSFVKSRSPTSIYHMKKAIKNNEFEPYVQPIMNNKNELAGLEVLIRWIKPNGMIYPDIFIPVAEKTEVIIPITEQLMDNVASQLNPFSSRFPKSFHIGINISAKHFDVRNQESLIECCKKFKETPTGIHSDLLIELTERELITDYEKTNQTIFSLHKLGTKLAIDDFGTGHSTLGYIKNLNIDTIKIDKSFIDLIETKIVTAQLVDNIIDLSKRLNVSIIAEGVETDLQAKYLIERGVDFLQGYYFAKPMTIDEFINQYLSKDD